MPIIDRAVNERLLRKVGHVIDGLEQDTMMTDVSAHQTGPVELLLGLGPKAFHTRGTSQ